MTIFVIPNPRLGAGEESAFELSVHDSRITIHDSRITIHDSRKRPGSLIRKERGPGMTAEANTDLRRQAVRAHHNKKAGGSFSLRLRVFLSGFTVSYLAVFRSPSVVRGFGL